MSADSDVVVVGAGIVGCQAARTLARDHDVHVLDSGRVAGEATGLSAGIIAPTLFYGDLPAVARHANAFVREFDGTGSFEFTARDRVDLVTADEAADARETADRRSDEGFPVTYLDADAVRERYPALSMDGFAGAVEYRDTGWVDPYSYATALAQAAESRGATIETDVTVTGLLVEDDGVAGVTTTEGDYRADAVVVAAGWRTRELLSGYVDLPVMPYRTQCLVLEPDDPLDESFPIVRVGTEHLYMRPEHNGDLLVGGRHDVVEDPASASARADEALRMQCAEAVPRLFEGFDRLGVVNDWAGVDGATPDARPIVDAPDGTPDGLVVATGFNGLGVMASPVVGPAVRELLGGEEAPFPLDPFAADRFDETGADFELRSTSEV